MRVIWRGSSVAVAASAGFQAEQGAEEVLDVMKKPKVWICVA